jgi:hypothetical protein
MLKKGNISMCIYCGTNKYRKIYENHVGPIPIDEDGRTYEIHHVDGNHSNNNIDNLVALTIKEHYEVHHKQKDWAACLKIGSKMKLSPEELSFLSGEASRARVEAGTHNFLDSERQRKVQLKLVEENRHNFTGPSNNQRRIKEGTHNLLGGEISKKITRKRIKEGTHNFLGSDTQKNRLEKGTHPSQTKKTCNHCGKTVSINMFARWHDERCKTL